jgi:hypothetical protein
MQGGVVLEDREAQAEGHTLQNLWGLAANHHPPDEALSLEGL